MAFHRLFRPAAAGICLLLVLSVSADEKKPTGELMLFDGESTFGLEITGDVAVNDGKLVIGGEKGGAVTTVAAFGSESGLMHLEYEYTGGLFDITWVEKIDHGVAFAGQQKGQLRHRPAKKGTGPIRLDVPAGRTLTVTRFAFEPKNLTPLFTGKDLAGWKPYTGDPKREKSKFAVTPAGELSVKDGPGDLQTEKAFADFLLQLECKTNGKGLNSGVFFRCLPGQYQQGYEAQVQNLYVGTDRTKPADFGTGAIYRRVAARKVVSDDNEWFTLTVLASGPTISTWVNGYPTVSWTDDRKPAENGRNGQYLKAGPISLQGHDPTTDLLFRNIRIAEIKN